MRRDAIVIGASAGGIDSLRALVATLPADFAVALLVVVHVPPYAKSNLPEILSRVCQLRVSHAQDGVAIGPGEIYVAPPNRHLMIEGARLRLSDGPRENGSRPAVDVLFRSAARWRGPRAVGVVLSGALDDGTAGLAAIHREGGTSVVLDPEDALFPFMPRHAIENVHVDHVVPAREIGPLLVALCSEDLNVPERLRASEADHEIWPEDEEGTNAPEVDVAKTELQGHPSSFTCPDCHGSLWEIRDGALTRYRCRVGHAFSPDSLLSGQLDSVEAAMWVAYRALEESASIAQKMAERSRARGMDRSAALYEEKYHQAIERAKVIHRALIMGDPPNRG